MFPSAAMTWAGVSGSGRVEQLLGVPLVSDSMVTVTKPLPHLILGVSSYKGKDGAKTRLSHRLTERREKREKKAVNAPARRGDRGG